MAHISVFIKLGTVLLALLLLTSCVWTKRLSSDESAWLPYVGNEILVFRSNRGETDTIFLTGRDTMYFSTLNPFLMLDIHYEEIVISSRHTDPSPPSGKHRYLNNNFVQLQTTKNSDASFHFELYAKGASFFKLTDTDIDSLAKLTFKVINTPFRQFTDVYVIHTNEGILPEPKESMVVDKLYWSRSQGLVRFDKRNGVYWELTNKYSP